MEIKKLLRNRNNRVMAIIFIIGLLILLFSSMVKDNNRGSDETPKINTGEEDRLSRILSEVEGAGNVLVMISYKAYEATDGIGRGFGYGTDEAEQEPRGVIVVADGAEDATVRNNLKTAAVAVTGVGANRVCVYDRDDNK